MERLTLHTRLRPDAVDCYEDTHRVVPDELDGALRAAGVINWTIWRDGCDLFHLVECADAATMWAALAASSANERWQARIGPLLELDIDHGGGTALTEVWTLPSVGPPGVSH